MSTPEPGRDPSSAPDGSGPHARTGRRIAGVRPSWLVLGGAVLVGSLVAATFDGDGGGTETVAVSGPPLPPVQAMGCPIVSPSLVRSVGRELVRPYELRLATSAQSGAVRWLVASVYDVETGARVSSADTWAEVDGQLYAVSSSAVDLSALPPLDRPELDPFGDPTRNDLEVCAIYAITG